MNDISVQAMRRLSAAGGFEMPAMDLSKPLSEPEKQLIRDAFLEHHILVFRNQKLSKEAQAAFTEQFGELEDHVVRQHDGSKTPQVHTVSNLDADGKPSYKPLTHGNYFWHTDKSYHAKPSLATLLHAIELPTEGGNTQFANTGLAYEALPEERKQAFADLKVVHSWEANRRNTKNKPATEEEKRERPPVTHPLIRTHPETGKKVLYVGIHTSHIVGKSMEESRELLDELADFCAQDEFVYSHEWQPGDLVMWDNRTTMHRAIANYSMNAERRILHRTVIKGDDIPH